eukprot:TRINITY_DN19455_c0_g1_i1.p2 TRINITY_DN19455_c0_g1~~TRINITY_DN19455_c0_g1_i1.p2  ORF type:complete len:176 (+),score=55.18 TRINITY_DN19455_c0_g1_i1:52-579(+)
MSGIGEGRAGNFNCSGPCGRKRLVAAEFSKKMVERWQKDMSNKITCKTCTLKAQEAKVATVEEVGEGEGVVCSACKKELPKTAYSGKQLRNEFIKNNTQRCKNCVLEAQKAERDAASNSKEQNLKELRDKAAAAEASGDKTAALKALTAAAAAEASIHSGVKVQNKAVFKARGKR